MHKIVLGVAMIVAGVMTGCAKQDPTARLQGLEPQRLSFGDPQTVQTRFSAKMQSCWFSGSAPVLQGYRYDTAAMVEGDSSLQSIKIYNGEAHANEAFEVQFHAYNANTLITTRNLSMPLALAAKLKRDIETWIFGEQDCGDQSGPAYRAQRPPPAAA